MRGFRLGYLTREGFKNIWVNRFLSVATILVLVACLIIVGTGSLIFLNINSLLDLIEGQNVVMVYVEDEATDYETESLGLQLQNMNNIKNVEFVPREDAFENQKEQFGDKAALLEGLSPEILPDAYKVVVDDLSMFDSTVKEIRKLESVLQVRENSDLASKVETIRNAVSYISLGIIAILFFVSMFIVSNTIRITIYNRRLEISIMKAVGATNSFIRWPFLVEGMLLGIISAVVSLVLEYVVYSVALIWFADLMATLGGTPVEFLDYIWFFLAVFGFIGVVIGTTGSLISLNKYLKEHNNVVEND
ncbi:MAG: permease-like cell division protein FtsX [Clostridia bacterium]|nr:permease-like cell division protein FtsX [Clostridia bacterium]